MKLEYFYFPDCPSHAEGLTRLKKVLAERGLNPKIEITCVNSDEQAQDLDFIGSPTILVDGRDVDPQGRKGQSHALACRIYRLEDGRYSPLPSEQMIRKALERAVADRPVEQQNNEGGI